jgi:sulfoxide reductase heme-binding subunit YedZ
MAGRRALKITTHIAALAPLAMLVWAFRQGQLGADPVGEAIRRTGRYAIAFILISLLPTAVRIVSGYRGLLPVRRALGLYAFGYAALHFAAFARFDYGLDVQLIWQAIRQGPREIVGLVALGLLLPLAITSTDGWIRRLGPWWRRLHRLVYVAGILAVWHHVWAAKELRAVPILTGVVLGILLVLRLSPIRQLLSRLHPRRRQKPARQNEPPSA